MKKSFACSVVCNGILGGKICVEDTAVIYKTNKLTVNSKYKNIVLPVGEICDLSWRWIVFPVATLKMTNGEKYKFLIFNKKGFNKRFEQVKKF